MQILGAFVSGDIDLNKMDCEVSLSIVKIDGSITRPLSLTSNQKCKKTAFKLAVVEGRLVNSSLAEKFQFFPQNESTTTTENIINQDLLIRSTPQSAGKMEKPERTEKQFFACQAKKCFFPSRLRQI